MVVQVRTNLWKGGGICLSPSICLPPLSLSARLVTVAVEVKDMQSKIILL